MSQIKRLPAATLAVAATLLCSLAHAQWEARFDFNSHNDQAQACVVDSVGNVYTVGKVKTSDSDDSNDLECVAYDSSGRPRWASRYDGPDGKDDFGTAIACDQNGDVYCSGVSKDTDGKGHFIVIKLAGATGAPVWPSSGSGGSGNNAYRFYNGAIQLNDNSDDGMGPQPDYKIRCAMSMRNEAGAQPTFAITGPSKANSSNLIRWRTCVFENDGSGGVRIKSGWPVDDYGTRTEDTANAVAIWTDNTVCVTGSAHQSAMAPEQDFTTVKYAANGASAVWRDSYNTGTKGGCGNAILFDSSGDVYATGAAGASDENQTYGTIKLHKDAHSPQRYWHKEYNNSVAGHHIAYAIGLSTELEDETPVDYVYVTGQSTSGSDGSLDVASVRYLGSDGTEEWTSRQTSSGNHDDKGLALVVGKTGNLYVTGIENEDFVMVGLNKSNGFTLFSPIVYDNGGFDESRSIVLLGSGHVVYTGTSFQTSQDQDFYTRIDLIGTATSYTPYQIDSFVTPAGGTTELEDSDDDYCSVGFTMASSSTINGYVDFTTHIDAASPTELWLTIESHVDIDHIWQEVDVYDQVGSAWVTVSDRPASNGTDDKTVVALMDDPARFLDGSGDILVRVRHYGNTLGTGYVRSVDGYYTAYFDQVRIDTIDP